MQQRDMNDEINNLKATIQDYTTKLAEERRRQEQANGGQHAQKLVEIQEAKAQATQARVSLESHRDTQTAISRDLDKAEKDLQNIKPAIRQKQEQIRNCQNQMRNIQSGQGNWSAGYHNNLSKLLRAIENERRFRETPVGPMGRHVRLLKPEWSSILEKQAGQSLNSFVVTNKADESILSNLMKQTG
jgi:chromosome segregation ATPase